MTQIYEGGTGTCELHCFAYNILRLFWILFWFLAPIISEMFKAFLLTYRDLYHTTLVNNK